MSYQTVLQSLVNGRMSGIGAQLAGDEREAVAAYVAGQSVSEAAVDEPPKDAMCARKAAGDLLASPAWNGWGVNLRNGRFQPGEAAKLRPTEVPKLELAWAFGFPGEILPYGQPAVASGRLYVGTQIARVYSLDAKTGCVHWVFKAAAGVRTAVALGAIRLGDAQVQAVFFGDQAGNVYAVELESGSLLWQVKVDEHPYAQVSGSLVLYDGRLFVPVSSFEELSAIDPGYECCTFRGSLVALDAATGRTAWKRYTVAQEPKPAQPSARGKQLLGPSGAAIWAAPTIDVERDAIYVVTGGNYSSPLTDTSDAVLAFDLNSGELLWRYQALAGDVFNVSCLQPDPANCPVGQGPDLDLGASPVLINKPDGTRALLAGQKSGMLYALDPDRNGKLLWKVATSRGGPRGGIQWGIASDDRRVYVPVSDWAFAKATATAQAGDSELETLPGMGAEGGMRAFDPVNGRHLWYAPPPACGNKQICSPAHSAAITAIPGVVFAGTLDGRIRAYSSEDGAVLWEYDTDRVFATVNGVPGSGGAIDGPGPVVVDGMLYLNSGYGRWTSKAGNVLLAFSVDNDDEAAP